MKALYDLNEQVKRIDLMVARAKVCQGELSEDYFELDDSLFIVCCHGEAGAKNDIVGDYLVKIRAEIRALQAMVKQGC